MARTKDLERKPLLIAQIIEYLLDRPLSSLSFRTLAEGLGVSTYTLVYHFGTRAELMHEIVNSVSDRHEVVARHSGEDPDRIQSHITYMREAWYRLITPRALQLQRLEFEAGMLETRQDDSERLTSSLHDHWTAEGSRTLIEIGLAPEDAEIESRIIVNIFYGLLYDVLVTRNPERATVAFERALTAYDERLRTLVAARP